LLGLSRASLRGSVAVALAFVEARGQDVYASAESNVIEGVTSQSGTPKGFEHARSFSESGHEFGADANDCVSS
jgi:hypothetical protein